MKIQQFDFIVDLKQALLWQYESATAIQTLVFGEQSWYNRDHTAFWGEWYRYVFNLETADDFGCTVWSLILNLPLFVPPGPLPDNLPIWGFGQYRKNFNRGIFKPHGSDPDVLTTAERRLLLRLRYFQLVSRCAIPEINKFLKYIFGEQGSTYLVENFNMSITLVFEWSINPKIVEAIIKYDLIPRGTGVLLHARINPSASFGFGPFHRNFNRGPFARDF